LTTSASSAASIVAIHGLMTGGAARAASACGAGEKATLTIGGAAASRSQTWAALMSDFPSCMLATQ
tara:strand:+ start:104 stop:301 length:198 start_codon:yes stop_codon:yes gene_type:complete